MFARYHSCRVSCSTRTTWLFLRQLTVTTNNGQRGVSYANLNLNVPPSGGTCAVERDSVGYVMRTIWPISCSDWADADGIRDYQFYSEYSYQTNSKCAGTDICVDVLCIWACVLAIVSVCMHHCTSVCKFPRYNVYNSPYSRIFQSEAATALSRNKYFLK